MKLAYFRDLLFVLVARDMKLRYKRSVLGILWSLLTPVTQLSVYYLVFKYILPIDIPNYLTFLFSGVLVWTWFQMSLLQVTTVVVDNRELIKHSGFPAAILPAVTVTSHLIHFLIALPILFVLLAIGGIQLTTGILALPLIIGIQFFFTLGLSYFLATFFVTFRDTQYLLSVFMNLLFFLTPIIYDVSRLPASYQSLFLLNPLAGLLGFYRAILFSGKLPGLGSLLFLVILTAVIFILGYFVFNKASTHFVDEL